jgi:hypothetical protein
MSSPTAQRLVVAALAPAVLAVGLAGRPGAALAQLPQIQNVLPANAPTVGGMRLTIHGADFGVTPGIVQIAGREIAPGAGSWTNSQIQFDLPEGDPGQTFVRVRRPTGESSNVWPGFSYDGPVLSSLSPGGGPARGGVPITIHGSNFGTSAVAQQARMGGKIALCQRVSHEELIFTMPNLPPGTQVDTWVEVNGLATGAVPLAVEPPVITNVSPMPGPTQGGVLITITGSNFGIDSEDPTPVVDIAGELCPVLARPGDSEMIALSAPGVGGHSPLTARVGFGLPGPPFEYAYQRPYVGAAEPAPGPAYSSFPITIHGSNFGPPGTYVEALLTGPGGTTPVVCGETDHFRAVGNVPSLPPGVYALEMFVVDQTSDPVPYTIGGVPEITSLDPFHGPTEGGTRLTIYGQNFSGEPVAVQLGPWECFIDTWSDNVIECITPPGYGAQNEVIVTAPGGGRSRPSYFSYDPPRLHEVDPMFLNPAGGQVITLRGENFGIAGAPLVVEFAGEPAPIAQWVSHHEVRVTSPPGAPNEVGLVCLRMGPAGEESCDDFQYGNPVGVEPRPLPAAFGLSLAGPNPSRGATAFEVDLPRDASYRLLVFDSAGRLVRRFDDTAPAGSRTVTWDGLDLRGTRAPAGLYWARLEVAGATFVQKAMRL